MTEESASITVAIADDHMLFRQGVHELLVTDPEIQVVGEAATGGEAVALVRRFRPDVLLLDVEMPGPGAQAVVNEVRRAVPETAVVILTMHESASTVSGLLRDGAAAYLVKSIGRAELLATVHSAGRGKSNVILSVSRSTVQLLEHGERESALLSTRERQVLELVSDALSNSQVATRLYISEGTVKRHLTNIYAKLNATSRVDAIRKAVELGLIAGIAPEKP